MQRITIKPFTVSGPLVRTTNEMEMSPKTAKISKLWQCFSEFHPANGRQPGTCYGVYSNYETNEQGAFDVLAGARSISQTEQHPEVTIPGGAYLRFEKKGDLPQAVMTLWQEIWHYFSKDNAPERSYNCDFEEYIDTNTVAIFIGIQE